MMNHEYNYFIIFNQSFWRWQRNLFCHSRKERQKDTEINWLSVYYNFIDNQIRGICFLLEFTIVLKINRFVVFRRETNFLYLNRKPILNDNRLRSDLRLY